ncbi:hypothetical protein [Pelagibacterium limicola]|uniref:hypothetical protein n=1 Tax=Pelagibacterium limicola TaxID=2791022 RepID=UPI001A9A9CCD|nr:hypothetical protein [Pelagibacterium limicola]
MKKALLSKLVSAVCVATLVLPLGAGSAVAQGACWDNTRIQAAVASGEIRPVADILEREGIPAANVTGAVKVCEQGGGLVYVLPVLEASGEARNLTVSAQ